MSAICGLLHLRGDTPSPDAISAMAATMRHRGSDGGGSWREGPVALAHRLLHTTPESLTEVQPVVRQAEGLSLVADARLDNREELIALLDLPRGIAHSDADLITASYLRWGAGCVDRILGDFSFVAWSARNRTLFCARDPMGVKPLYYARSEQFFAFGSELKALLAVPGIHAEIDENQVALFIGWNEEDRSRTIYRSLMRLPAGHTLLVSGDRLTLRRYWNPEGVPDVRFASDAEYVEAFRDRFEKAVAARQRSVGPLGATLSGGLDSSSIACMSRHLRRDDSRALHTFSVIFPTLPENELRLIDERRYVDVVIGGGGVQPHFIRGDERSPLHEIERVLWHLDEPHWAPNLYVLWAIFGAAHENGVRVLLDGFDGDSAISHGFARLTSLTRMGDLDTLESELSGFSAHHGRDSGPALRQFVLPQLAELARRGRYLSWIRSAGRLARRFHVSRRELVKEFGLRPLMPAPLRARSRSLRDVDLPARRLLQPSLARVLGRYTLRSTIADLRRHAPTEREAHLHGLLQPAYQWALEAADKTAAAFQVEPRYPFFDRRLIEFCVGLPEEQKFAGGWPRLVLRRAMEGILPPEIQWRSVKSNLSPNFHRRFRSVDLAQNPAIGTPASAPYIKQDAIRDLRDRYGASTDGVSMRAEGLALFRAMILEKWLLQRKSDNKQPNLTAGVSSPAAA